MIPLIGVTDDAAVPAIKLVASHVSPQHREVRLAGAGSRPCFLGRASGAPRPRDDAAPPHECASAFSISGLRSCSTFFDVTGPTSL
jgi:hypothetical protein